MLLAPVHPPSVSENTRVAYEQVPQLMGARGDPNRVVYSDGGFFYPTEIEPMTGDCDLGDDFYGKRGLEEILNFSGVNPSAPTSVSHPNLEEIDC